MNLLGDQEKGRRALNHSPAGFKADRIHQKRERCKDFGDAAPVKRRADVNAVQRANPLSLAQDAFDGCGADERFVLFETTQAQRWGLQTRSR